MKTFATLARKPASGRLSVPCRAPTPAAPPAPLGQAQVGEAHVRHILHGPRLQPKLTVGAPGDAYEREADRVADAVMRMPEGPTQRVQRVCAECEEEMQRMPVGDMEDEEKVRAKELPGRSPAIDSGLEARIQALRGGGRPLPAAERAFFEPRFGADFGAVRVHAGGEAAQLAGALKAQAFTVGRDVVFGAGHYAPESPRGRSLLAHELTHVLQQGGDISAGPRRKPAADPGPGPLVGGPRLRTGGARVQASNDCTYGEIRSWAITSQSDLTAPAGLADAKASIGAACSRNPCHCVSGAGATAPGDQAAWRNIVAASGGTDQSGGGNFMCVGHEGCWFVHSCYACRGGNRTLTARASNLAASGTTTVAGRGTLYFYNDPLQGWCNSADRSSGCRARRGR